MTQKPPPSPPFRPSIFNSSLSPGHALAPVVSKSSNGTENISGASAGPAQLDSAAGFKKSPTRSETVFEDAPTDIRQSGITRRDSINPHASNMSLYDFRRKSLRFHWEDSTSFHKTLPEDALWPLNHVGELSSREKAKARVWASEVTESKHGFTDTVADKIVKYKTDEDKRWYYTKGRHLGILMFPVAAWDLEQFLESPSVGRRREMMRPWFSCLSQALLFLHTRNKPIKHRDIKPANILIDISGAVFLTDFGIAKEYASNQAAVTRGDGRYTIEYASPQMVKQDDQGLESDIFCLGCVFLEMATIILGKELEEMYKYILGLTGMSGRVHYHRDFAQVSMWAEDLQKSVRNRPYIAEYEKHLVEEGLQVIIRMIKECASREKTEHALLPAMTLENISRAFEPLSPEQCRSCKVVPETKLEEERVDHEEKLVDNEMAHTAGAGVNAEPRLSHETQRRLSNQASVSVSPNLAGVSHGTVLHKQSSYEVRKDASLPPSIILQRQATDLSKPDGPAGPKVENAHTPFPSFKIVSEGTSDVEQVSASSGNIHPSPLPYDLTHGSIPTKPPEMSAMMEGKPKSAPIRDEPHRAFSPLHHRSTEPISMTSTNSRIRMVDTRWKRRRVVSFDCVNDIPGAEILVFDQEQRKWRAHQKSRVPFEQGFLWRLPRDIGRKYWTPLGYLRPWKDLTASKNFKRIFGKSMLTMFIEGRQTAAQLEALYSQEDDC